MHVRSCCFTNVILMIFFLCRSRYRRRPHRLSSLQTLPRFFIFFNMDYLEKSRRHQWKERLKLKVVKLLEI